MGSAKSIIINNAVLDDGALINKYQMIIKDKLKQCGMSLHKLSIISDVNHSTLHKMLNDHTRMCQFNNLYRVFSALQLPLSLVDNFFQPYENNLKADIETKLLPILKLNDLKVDFDYNVFTITKWTNFASCPFQIAKDAMFAIKKKEFLKLNDKLNPLLLTSTIDNNNAFLYINKVRGAYTLDYKKCSDNIFYVVGCLDDI